MKTIFYLISTISISVLLLFHQESFAQPGVLKAIDLELSMAKANTLDNQLVVSSGMVKRTWNWTGSGFQTVGIEDLESGREWCTKEARYACDWLLPGLINDTTQVKLVSLTAKISDDEHFTSKHIEVVAEIHYETQVAVQYVIWVYPGAPGIRTQLKVKALHGMDQTSAVNLPARNEYIPLDWSGLNRRAIGYYNNTQHSNAGNLRLLREELFTGSVLQPEKYDWASLLIAEDKSGGLVLVKESHKCVNQQGLSTGAFHADARGFSSTGWGIQVKEIIEERWRSCWAHWLIPYTGGDNEREMAIKKFDRTRYPVDPELDIYILANTWGSGNNSEASREENVLLEMDVQSDLGIDVQQIDDGWQNPKGLGWISTTEWAPHTDRYPEGWQNVISSAKEKEMKLGIWFAVGSLNNILLEKYGNKWYADLEDIKQVYDQGKFTYYKFDMVNLNNYDDLESLMDMSRKFIQYTGHTTRINWDVTEIEARTGYYFARDMGNIYLANRKSKLGKNVVYVPYIMLRDAWQVSKYVNLNKFQVSIQNIDETDREVSNGHLYNHPYSVAIALMGSPIFFQETHYYSKEARDQIRPLLKVYKQHRNEMFKGYVFPIGDEPDDRSWTGFQNYYPEANSGYLMVFRELYNSEANHRIQLRFLSGKTINMTNLVTGKTNTVRTDQKGFVDLSIDKPAGFLYLKYSIK